MYASLGGMGPIRYRRGLILSIAATLLALSCKRSQPPAPEPAPAPVPESLGDPSSPPVLLNRQDAKAPRNRQEEERDSDLPSPSPSRTPTRLTLTQPIDLGPAAPVVATPLGALFRLQDDDLALAKWNPKAKSGSEIRKIEGPFLSPRAPEPAVAGDQAYFVSQGRLVRRAFPERGALEVLAQDAVEGTRPAARLLENRPVVAYIAEPSQPLGERRARVWMEGAGLFDLSPEGSGATSVALLELAPGKLLAASIEGRTSMSPIHARAIEWPAKEKPRIGPDVVLTVAPAAERHTELTLAASKKGPVVLVPLADGPRDFGLMSMPIGPDLDVGSPHWLLYPNGLDPAPVAAARFCGESYVVFARPEAADPSSPTVLELGILGQGAAVTAHSVLARGVGIRFVSLATTDDSALLVWNANGRSFARTLRC